jgi:hypothetical protein
MSEPEATPPPKPSDPQALKRPEETFNGDNLPDDLKWIMAHFGLPKHDPAVVLIAWHWFRVNQGADVLKNGTLALQVALDARLQKVNAGSAAVENLVDLVENLTALLSPRPLAISQQIESELKIPITDSVKACSKLAVEMNALLSRSTTVLKTASRRQLLACLMAGFATGTTLTAWIFCLFYTR